MATEFTLDWQGPFGWFGSSDNVLFRRGEAKLKGIYLWAIHVDTGYLTYYVGETGKSYGERLKVHAHEYLSGIYRIYNPVDFQHGKKVPIWQGTWKKGTEDLLPDFLERYDELAPKILKMLSLLNIFIAPVDSESRIRKRIESSIARCLYDKPEPVCSFQESDIIYARRKSDEKPLTIINKFHDRIRGLDDIIGD